MTRWEEDELRRELTDARLEACRLTDRVQQLEVQLAGRSKDTIQELASLLEVVADAYYHLNNPQAHVFCDGCGRASSLGPPYHEPDCIVLRVQDLLARVKVGANDTCADHDFLTGIDNIVCGMIEGASREETAEALLRFVLESGVGKVRP